MMKSNLRNIIIASLLLLLFCGQNVYAKKMFRWVDEQGRVFFSDKVPQDQIKHKRESLNDEIRVVDVVEKEKTEEQKKLEKRLRKLRRKQQKIVEQQKSHDKVLLTTFRNLDDMKRALKGKLSALDVQRKVAEVNLHRLETQLQNQLKKAASFERSGKKVPDKLFAEIIASKEQVVDTQDEILRQIETTAVVKKEFEIDIARFSFLTQSDADAGQLSSKTGEYKAAKELGLFICKNTDECEKAWKIAGQFVEKYSTTREDITADKLIMRATPAVETDVSLSVSRLKLNGNKHQIFLDIRCHISSMGKELCASPKIETIRNSFSRFIRFRLAP